MIQTNSSIARSVKLYTRDLNQLLKSACDWLLTQVQDVARITDNTNIYSLLVTTYLLFRDIFMSITDIFVNKSLC